MPPIVLTTGAIAGSVIAMPALLGTEESWWYIYLAEFVALLPVLAALPFIPESPGYFIITLKLAIILSVVSKRERARCQRCENTDV